MPNLPTIFKQLARSGIALVFPLQCPGCHASGRLLCSTCIAKLPRLEPPSCPVCCESVNLVRCNWRRLNQPKIDGIRAPFPMQGVFRELIHRFKYRNLRAATPVLGQLLGDYLPSHPMPGQIIVPVPLYRRRLRSRGYNQATLLAQELSKLTNPPVDSVLLARRQDALPQAETSCRQQRADNVRGNFEWNSGVSGLEVMLIDDVSTNGSTLSECAAVLKDAGAVSVWGLALAKEA